MSGNEEVDEEQIPGKPTDDELSAVIELRRLPGKYTPERHERRTQALEKLLARYRWLEKGFGS
jgi:hypothetical protein